MMCRNSQARESVGQLESMSQILLPPLCDQVACVVRQFNRVVLDTTTTTTEFVRCYSSHVVSVSGEDIGLPLSGFEARAMDDDDDGGVGLEGTLATALRQGRLV